MAIPSTSVSAVDAERRGLAARLPAAIEPDTPAARRAAGELQRAEAVTSAGPHSTSAGTMAAAGTSHIGFALTNAAAPATIAAAASASPPAVRVRLTRRGSAALSRSASTGAVAAARRAGIHAEQIVAPIPTPAATATETGLTIVGPVIRLTPVSPTTQRNAPTPATPHTRPTSVASVARTAASVTTVPSTWRRCAPIARSSPDSRRRRATVSANVLKMIVTPIRTAAAAKASRNTFRNCSGDVALSCVARMWSGPSTTSASDRADSRPSTSAWSAVSAMSTRTSVGAAVSSQAETASSASRTVRCSGAASADANVAIPVTVASCIPVAVSTCTASPGATPASSASERSIMISPGPAGGRPLASRNGLSAGSVIQLRPTSLAVPAPTVEPSATSFAKPTHCETALSTPSTAPTRSAMSGSSDCRTDRAGSPGPPPGSPRETPCTTASVPASASAMSSAARPRIESVSTSVETRNATDRAIAVPVSQNRPRFAITLRVALRTIRLIAPDPSSRRAPHRPTGGPSRRALCRRRRTRRGPPRQRRWDRA